MPAKKRWLVRCDFWDHTDSDNDPGLLHCTVWGVLTETTKTAYHILKWETAKDPKNPNSEFWAIAKSAVINLEKIRLEK